MKKLSLLIAIGLSSIMLFNNNAQAQTDKPYTEGQVWIVQFMQTKPGMEQAYMKNTSEHWIKVMEQAKKEGIIMDYKILSSNKTSPTDWDLMTLVELKNFAALDSVDKKLAPVIKQVMGSKEAEQKREAGLKDFRVYLGGKLTRELIFK